MQAGAAENGDPAAGETVKRGADPGGQMGLDYRPGDLKGRDWRGIASQS